MKQCSSARGHSTALPAVRESIRSLQGDLGSTRQQALDPPSLQLLLPTLDTLTMASRYGLPLFSIYNLLSVKHQQEEPRRVANVHRVLTKTTR